MQTLDDRVPSAIYSGGTWGAFGVAGSEYMGTVMKANRSGMSVTLPFAGTSISVFGTLYNRKDAPAPRSSYQIDGQKMGAFAPAIPATIQYKQQFFQSGVLNPGAHMLVVTNVVDGGALYLDYFEVTPGVVSIGTTIPTPLPASTVTTITHASTGSGQIPYDPNSSTSDSTSTSNKPTNIGPSPNLIPTKYLSSQPSSQSTDVSQSTRSSTIPIAPIIGSSIAGALLLVFAVFAILFFRRRRRVKALTDMTPYQQPVPRHNQDVWHQSPDTVLNPYSVTSSTDMREWSKSNPVGELRESQPPLYTRNP